MKAPKMTELTLAALLVCGLTTMSSAMAQTAAPSVPVAPAATAQMSSPASAMPLQPVTLEEYLRMVVRNRPSLAADRMEAGLARADTRTASAFPNPSLSAYGKPGEHGIGIDQPIPIFGQRGARIETAKKGELAADAHVEVAVNAVLNDAAQAFNDLP